MKIDEQLERAGIKGGTWVDAGCGTGAYTFALADHATKVIGIDISLREIDILKEHINKFSNHYIHKHNAKIETRIQDFNESHWLEELVDGVIFTFSLHYQKDRHLPLRAAWNQLKPGGMVIIIDYDRTDPVPWIPIPFPFKEAIKVVRESGFTNTTPRHLDERFYILSAEKRNN